LWEGVPLREVLKLVGKISNIRRVYYSGFHNNDPKQLFQSSLGYNRVMETPPGDLQVFVAYRLNGEPIPLIRGGPVRMVVPWAHGFKSIKWLTHVVLSNLAHANDTYADGNNDVDSPLKTFAATLSVPREVKAGDAIAVTGYAQVGISGLSKVQVWIAPAAPEWPAEDKYFATAPLDRRGDPGAA
jgi:DMSO/TMAO reductase YedYZ molybdopterin-dependent catalytic subunit